MDQKEIIHNLIEVIAYEILQFIKSQESGYDNGWVPAADIKNSLDLNFVAVPISNKQYGEKGWFFAIMARLLEDKELVEFMKDGSRSFYRSSR